MHKCSLTKPDGRRLWLYGMQPIETAGAAPSPSRDPIAHAAHLRWHPLRGEWIAYATHRQHRTFLPPREFNPLAPTTDPAAPTELPPGRYDVAVFENLFPSLATGGGPPPSGIVRTAPADGAAEVVVFTQDPMAALGSLPLAHIELIVDVWADRYRDLGSRPEVKYVFIFENRGVEVGVTLHHPHGQIYAYPFVPPIPARELALQEAYYREHGRGLIADWIRDELRDRTRIVWEGRSAIAAVPVFARYSYEVWIATREAVPSIDLVDAGTRHDLARALKAVLMTFDRLWNKPFPYVMVFHQAPTDGGPHPEAHLHIEFYPPYRLEGRLKYLAGSELGAGVFTADTLPEERAAELRAVRRDESGPE
jgi:UDPglucose--hexose-1-phosphate uridylyltransferase